MIFTDQMGHQVFIPHPPRRIVSLVPSQTELLLDLGLGDRVIGITRFCIHPGEQVKGKTIVGGTKNFYPERIRALKPDLIIGNKEENYEAGIRELQREFPVWMSDITNLEGALDMIRKIGHLTGVTKQAEGLATAIKTKFSLVTKEPTIPVVYLIWKDPYMTIGQDTFIDDMLTRAGFANVFRHLLRYPQISAELLQQARPRAILLSSEPYPFKEKHLREIQQICPEAHVKLVDGEMFSWYGSRLQLAPAYFHQLQQELKSELGLGTGFR